MLISGLKKKEGKLPDVQWYLIHSKNRQEMVAECNLRHLGIETFCPRMRAISSSRSKTQREGDVLFPGYLFVKVDIETQCRKITYAQGVQKVVKFGAAPAVVEEEIIHSIRERVQNGLVPPPLPASFEPREKYLKFGQIVQIKNGPLEGLQAIFEQELNGAQRVALLMKTVAFQGRVIIDRYCVGI